MEDPAEQKLIEAIRQHDDPPEALLRATQVIIEYLSHQASPEPRKAS